MSILSSLNNVTTKVVRIAVGNQAANVYKETSEALGGAALETVVVAGELTSGTVSTVAAAIPALASYTKGVGMGILQASTIEEFTKEWAEMSAEDRQKAVQEMGSENIKSLIQALKEQDS